MQLEYESLTMGYTFKAEFFMQDNTTISQHFLQDPFNPIPHPIQQRRRRHALLVASNEHDMTHDPIEVNDHYEKYDVEAIEIDTGLNGIDIDEDEEYDDGESEENHDESDKTANYVMSKPKDFSTARWTLFKGIEMLAQKFVEKFRF